MARTKASVGAKISSGKSSKARCSAAPPSNTTATGSSERSRASGGGNPVCPRETPKWQRPITNFFIGKQQDTSMSDNEKDDGAGTSKPKNTKRNIIESDEETEVPTNKELDETLNLEPLSGESSHKLEEYYIKKDKGKGKKTKETNNNVPNERKRLREDDFENESKKIKV